MYAQSLMFELKYNFFAVRNYIIQINPTAN